METLNTYKPNAHFKLITFEMLDKIAALNIPKNEKFNFCRPSLSQAIINPLKVSYIKKDKIKSLKEHANVNITLSPTPEQRNKYFNACSLEKFANHIFNKETISAEQLNDFNNIVKEAKEKANATLTKEIKTFNALEIPFIYNLKKDTENETYKGFYVGKHNDLNASCMQGKPRKYFEIYTDINESQAVEMATLIQGNEIVARALVWLDVPADEIGKGVIQPRDIYIDRIYTKTQEHREETQAELYFQILKKYKVETEATQEISTPSGAIKKIILPNCYNAFNIREKATARLNTTKEIILNSYCRFDVETNSNDYNYYPYCDTLTFFDTYNQRLTADEESGSDILKLDSTSGEATNAVRCCDQCGNEMYEDDERYIETEEMSVCPECAIYCDERDEYILLDDAIYNSHSGTYHYRGDLDI